MKLQICDSEGGAMGSIQQLWEPTLAVPAPVAAIERTSLVRYSYP